MTQPADDRSGLRVGHVPGVTLTKWRTRWAERLPEHALTVVEVAQDDQLRALRAGEVDACFVRDPDDTDGLHAIVLYQEVTVAWVSRDHPAALFEELTLADVAGETVLTDVDEDALMQVGFGDAVLLVPMSVARSHSRRDLVLRPVTDAAGATVSLAWRIEDPHPLVDELVGIVRGRTANSSRTARERGTAAPPRTAAPAKVRRPERPRGPGGRRARRAR